MGLFFIYFRLQTRIVRTVGKSVDRQTTTTTALAVSSLSLHYSS